MSMEQGIGSSERGLGGRGLRLRMVVLLVAGIGALVGSAQAGPVPDYDFDWAVIGDPGNAGLDESPFPPMLGRGAVEYEYRIGKLEITTAQWMEYVNTFSTQGDEYRNFARPLDWGAQSDSSYGGPGRRWVLRGLE